MLSVFANGWKLSYAEAISNASITDVISASRSWISPIGVSAPGTTPSNSCQSPLGIASCLG
jgi:hypothetical protein